MAKGKKENILVRVPNWIGDAVMSLPAIEALARLYPSSVITVLARKRVIPVFAGNPNIKYIMEYEGQSAGVGLLGRLRLSKEMRRRGFDKAVLFQNAFEAAFIAYFARIPERVGYARDLRSLLLTKALPFRGEIRKRHQAHYYLNIIKEMGGKVPEDPIPSIPISREEAAWAARFLEEKGLKGKRLVGAAPGASYGPAKRWPTESFASVLKRLSLETGMVPLVFGGPEDNPVCEEVVRAVGGACLNLAGKTALRQSMALLKKLDLFITNDSGPMHISAALGVPTVALFGSTDPVLTGPLGKETMVIIKNVECSPCFERECRHGHYRCLKEITADEVYAASMAMVKAKR